MPELPIEALVVSTHNMRSLNENSALEAEYIKLLAENISMYGLLHPLTVHPLGDGKFEILAGQRRWKALRALGYTTVPCTVLEEVENPLAISFSENLQRNNMLKRDTCRIIGQMAETYNQDLVKVARLMQMTLPTVKRYAAIYKLADDTLARLDSPGDDHLTLQAAERLVQEVGTVVSAEGGEEAVAETGEKKERKKPIKSEPWIYGEDHKPVSIPATLHAKVLALVLRAAAAAAQD